VSHQKLVREFHEKFGIPVRDKPGVPSDERVRLRLRLIAEEFFELIEAAIDTSDRDAEGALVGWAKEELSGVISRGPVSVDLPEFVDALADLEYVILGSGVELGVDLHPVFLEVDHSNKTKAGGGTRSDGKLLKGPDYEPPQIERLLVEQGWER
jgi:predicted HAD superfamily Cof-like phosphohydrolase